jgi:hypothetical protein
MAVKRGQGNERKSGQTADQALYYAKAHGRNQAVRVLAGPARPETPEQAEKLLKNLEYGEQKGYIIKKVFRTSGDESSSSGTPG